MFIIGPAEEKIRLTRAVKIGRAVLKESDLGCSEQSKKRTSKGDLNVRIRFERSLFAGR